MKIRMIFPLILAVVMPGCQKEPTACFEIEEKANYYTGEGIRMTNCSVDAYSFIWELPDGQKITDKNIIFTPADPGTYNIGLTALSKSGKKSNYITHSIVAENATGQIMFWANTEEEIKPITVRIGNSVLGNITLSYMALPDCGSEGCVTVSLPVGNYSFHASDENYIWAGSITVLKDECSTMELLL